MTKYSMLVVGFLVAAALPARAEEVNPHLEQGLQLLRDMEDDRAVEAFKKALTWPKNTSKVRAQIRVQIGIARSNQMNRDAAVESFRRALADDPEASLPERTSPKIHKLFEQARAELEQEKKPPTPQPQRPPPVTPPVNSTPPADEEPSHLGKYWPAWVAASVTVGAAVGGVILGALSNSAEDSARDQDLTYDEAKNHHDTASRRALGANIMFGIAGAAAITTGVLFYLGYRKDAQQAAVVAPVPGGVVVQLRGVTW